MATTPRQSLLVPAAREYATWQRQPFDPALGTLTSINVDMTATIGMPGLVVENLDTAPTTLAVRTTGSVLFEEVKFSYRIDAQSSVTELPLAAFDGIADGTGASAATTSGTVTATADEVVPAPSGLASRASLHVYSLASYYVTGGADFRVDAALPPSMSTELGLSYNYTPQAPSPDTSPLQDPAPAAAPAAAIPGTLTTARQRFVITDDGINWSQVLQAMQFNPANGTLVSVNLSVAARLSSTLSAENRDATYRQTILGGHSISISPALAGTSLPLTASSTTTLTTFLDVADGTDDFSGSGGGATSAAARGSSAALSLTDSNSLAAFAGTGTVALTLNATGEGRIEGLAAALAELAGISGAILDVSYTFQPSAAQVPIATYNATTQAVETPTPVPYSGPVAGLDNSYINITTDNLAVTAATENWFIRTGNGNDAIAIGSGTNVIDAGGGSNFIVGGTGRDMIFLHTPDTGEAGWTTIAAFESGDSVTIWGDFPSFTPQWVENEGADGYKGLTLHIPGSQPGVFTSLTLSGVSLSDPGAPVGFIFGNMTGEVTGPPYLYIYAP